MYLTLDSTLLRDAAHLAQEGILDGRVLKNALLDHLRDVVSLLREREIFPKLVVIQVGEDPASTVYVRHKIKACARVGIESASINLAHDTPQDDLLAHLRELNADPSVHGILLQLPLPLGLDANEGIMLIDPRKDVDGFHPYITSVT